MVKELRSYEPHSMGERKKGGRKEGGRVREKREERNKSFKGHARHKVF